NGWRFHEVVRTQMLRHKRRESPQDFAELHGRLAQYYERIRDDLGLDEIERWHNSVWQYQTLDVFYHRLCHSPHKFLSKALNGFLEALKGSAAFARRWAEMIQQVGQDIDLVEVQHWGKRLIEGLKAYDEDRYEAAEAMFTALLQYTE